MTKIRVLKPRSDGITTSMYPNAINFSGKDVILNKKELKKLGDQAARIVRMGEMTNANIPESLSNRPKHQHKNILFRDNVPK